MAALFLQSQKCTTVHFFEHLPPLGWIDLVIDLKGLKSRLGCRGDGSTFHKLN